MKLNIDSLGKVAITINGTHNQKQAYDKLCCVYSEATGISYISKIPVPPNISITDDKYWQKLVNNTNIGTTTKLAFSGIIQADIVTEEQIKLYTDSLTSNEQLWFIIGNKDNQIKKEEGNNGWVKFSKVLANLVHPEDSRGVAANLGDILLIAKDEEGNPLYNVIPLNDAKSPSDDNTFPGTYGILTPNDRMDIDNTMMQTYQTSQDGDYSDACINTGFYPYVTSGKPEGSEEGDWFMLVVHRSCKVDSKGNFNIEQTAYGRGTTGKMYGKIFKRVLFHNPTENKTTTDGWIDISSKNGNIPNNVGLALISNQATTHPDTFENVTSFTFTNPNGTTAIINLNADQFRVTGGSSSGNNGNGKIQLNFPSVTNVSQQESFPSYIGNNIYMYGGNNPIYKLNVDKFKRHITLILKYKVSILDYSYHIIVKDNTTETATTPTANTAFVYDIEYVPAAEAGFTKDILIVKIDYYKNWDDSNYIIDIFSTEQKVWSNFAFSDFKSMYNLSKQTNIPFTVYYNANTTPTFVVIGMDTGSFTINVDGPYYNLKYDNEIVVAAPNITTGTTLSGINYIEIKPEDWITTASCWNNLLKDTIRNYTIR